MKLDDLKSNPTQIRVDLKISGPISSVSDSETIHVKSRVVSKDSDVVHTDSIKTFANAVMSATAAMGALQGTTQRIEVAAGGKDSPNCYWLPWGTGKLYMGQLGGAHDYFFTYTINGCGVLIGGTDTQPQVAHANLSSKRLDCTGVPPEEIAKKQALVYEQFYGNLAATLIGTNKLNGHRIEVVTPDQYLIRAGAGFGVIFGVKGIGDAWMFYGNWGRQTKRIWP
jgi:hypothetical protein